MNHGNSCCKCQSWETFPIHIIWLVEDLTTSPDFLYSCLPCNITIVKIPLLRMQIRLFAEVKQSCRKLVLTVAIQWALHCAGNNNRQRLDRQSMEIEWVQRTTCYSLFLVLQVVLALLYFIFPLPKLFYFMSKWIFKLMYAHNAVFYLVLLM